MGCVHPKTSNTPKTSAQHTTQDRAGLGHRELHRDGPEIQDGTRGRENINWEELETQTQLCNLNNLREDMKSNPETFLINLILMSVQFLKNYEKDKDSVVSHREAEKARLDSLLVDNRKNVLLATGVFNKIQDYLSYNEPPGQTLEPFTAQTYLFCFNNIEAFPNEDYDRVYECGRLYTNLDNPLYRVCIEQSTNPGYVKVRCVDDPFLSSKPGSSTSSTSRPVSQTEEKEDDPVVDIPDVSLPVPVPVPVPVHPSLQRPRREYNESLTRTLVSVRSLAPPSTNNNARRNSFDTVKEEEEEEEGPTPDWLDNLKARVGTDNYFRPRESSRLVGEPGASGERRPSGVLPQNKMDASLRPMFGLVGANTEIQESPPRSPSLMKAFPSQKPPLVSTGDQDVCEDDYAYVRQRPVPLPQFEQSSGRGSIISNSCFLTREVAVVEDDETDPYPIQAETEARTYLSSKQLMHFFNNQFHELARTIGKGGLTGSARVLPPRILCREEVEGTFKELKWHFIPSIEVSHWPDKEAWEFVFRKRTVMRDKRTQVSYQWPSKSQLDCVRQLGCNIVPIGFLPPKKILGNQDYEIEWEIYFTKAELYLTRNLHHPKLRVYFFAVLIFRCYLEMFDGLTEKHIRYLFYWMVEKSPADWTEENVGEKFLELLRSLKVHLVKQKMPHYFISKRNMFANIPNHKLLKLQEKVHKIRENPVFHLLHCLQKLRPEKGFYPMLDIEQLYAILTVESCLMLVHPGLVTSHNNIEETGATTQHRTARKEGRQGDRYQEYMRTKRQNREAHKHEASHDKTQTQSGINVDAQMKSFDESRQKLLLEFFASHFLKMAERSHKFRSYGQSYMYLRTTENLLTLLEEMGYESRENKLYVRKLRDNINYSLYVKDYWMVSYSHVLLDDVKAHTTRSSLASPDLPQPPVEKKRQKNINNEDTSAEIHGIEVEVKETKSLKKKESVTVNKNDSSDISICNIIEMTHL